MFSYYVFTGVIFAGVAIYIALKGGGNNGK
jgi:hypothetical protein